MHAFEEIAAKVVHVSTSNANQTNFPYIYLEKVHISMPFSNSNVDISKPLFLTIAILSGHDSIECYGNRYETMEMAVKLLLKC